MKDILLILSCVAISSMRRDLRLRRSGNDKGT